MTSPWCCSGCVGGAGFSFVGAANDWEMLRRVAVMCGSFARNYVCHINHQYSNDILCNNVLFIYTKKEDTCHSCASL